MVRCDSSNFSRGTSRIAVAQLCETVGFEGFDDSALDSLADMAIRYISDLGKTAIFYANVSGRTQCNVFDIIQVLKDLDLSQNHSDVPDENESVMSTSVMREIKEYVGSSEEVPFAQPVPSYPVLKDPKPIPSFLQMAETPSSKHIPSWLPAFPDQHTYVRTPVWNERVSDPRADKIELARQHRKAERSLLSLQKRLVAGSKDSDVVISEEPDEVGVEKTETLVQTAEDLVPRDGERLKIDQAAKNLNEKNTKKQSSLMETFAPAIEALGELDSGSDNERVLTPVKRVPSFLELKSGRRVFGEPLDLRIRNKAPGKPAPWFGREDERDDKKRRVEYILRQAMENQHELSQL